MAEVKATQRGYFGGVIRDAGDKFVIDDEIMKDKKRRPSWVILAAFGGKGDHDGDGVTGGAKSVDAPNSLDDLTLKELRDLAKARGIDLGGATAKADIVKAIEGAGVSEPFADAPEPTEAKPRGNGVKEALGTAPDWVAPKPID